MSDDKRSNTDRRRHLASETEATRFFELARQYAKTCGTTSSLGYICGFIGVPAFVYEDLLVRISAARSGPALEVVYKYPSGKITNPVIGVNDQGEVIRIHGEHCYVVPHIEDLAIEAGLTLDGGRCCSGATPRTCGCAFSWDCVVHGATCVSSHD